MDDTFSKCLLDCNNEIDCFSYCTHIIEGNNNNFILFNFNKKQYNDICTFEKCSKLDEIAKECETE
jgi:hypothetical protein